MKDPLRLRLRDRLPSETRPGLIAALGGYQSSRWISLRAREAIGRVLARVEKVRIDDLKVVLHLVRDWTYRRATLKEVEDAAHVALFFAEDDHPEAS